MRLDEVRWGSGGQSWAIGIPEKENKTLLQLKKSFEKIFNWDNIFSWFNELIDTN